MAALRQERKFTSGRKADLPSSGTSRANADVQFYFAYRAEMLPLTDRYPLPSVPRLVGGLILAGSLPGALVALLTLPGGSLSNALGFGTFLGVFYGVGPALILGLPAVYGLRGVVAPSLKASVVAGVLVASAPVVLAVLTIGVGLALALLAAVPLGGIGGAVFWLVALRGLKPLLPDDASPPGLVE